MPSALQREVLGELFKGASLRMRFNKYGRPGDFLLVKRGGVIAVVPRKTVVAICRMARSSWSPPIEEPAVAIAPVQRKAKPVPPAPEIPLEEPILDDLSRSLAGKAFARLQPYEQDHIRSLATRIQGAGE